MGKNISEQLAAIKPFANKDMKEAEMESVKKKPPKQNKKNTPKNQTKKRQSFFAREEAFWQISKKECA